MLRILLVHNFYGSEAPSGENQVFESERELLGRKGHAVESVVRYSDTIRSAGKVGLLIGAASTPWNAFAAQAIRSAVRRFRPDVVHVHNTFPLFSPAIFQAIGTEAATVLTLHNYRLFCAAGIPMRSGEICTTCIDERSSAPALRYGCYRNSRLMTIPLAASVGLHRYLGTWRDSVDAFVTLSEFQRQWAIKGGLAPELVHVKPNFYPGNPKPRDWSARKPAVIFAGRLTSEKGAHTLLRAWSMWGTAAPELRIIGDGPLRGDLERLARGGNVGRVSFLGRLSREETVREIASARLLVLPSECFEGLPTVLIEAFALGTPVVASSIGPLSALVTQQKNGDLFRPGDPEALKSVTATIWGDEQLIQRLSVGAHETFQALYSEGANYEALGRIYEEARVVNHRRASA